MGQPQISVVIPTHNPDPTRFGRTITGLRAQSLPPTCWELIIVDNASDVRRALETTDLSWHPSARVVEESHLGLTSARQRGFRESRANIIVLVDDDNVLAPNYLTNVESYFVAHPQLGAAGGKSLPEFESTPERWQEEFYPLLALRDLGADPIISPISDTFPSEYPLYAPIGAGMAVRRRAVDAWLEQKSLLSDRKGRELTSGGDNDLVLSIARQGWQIAYFPDLVLTHLIPSGRLDPEYLARLNYGVQKTWMQVLALYGLNPWPAIAGWTVPLRKAKAWITYRSWGSTAAHIRWRGACGHFDGRAAQMKQP